MSFQKVGNHRSLTSFCNFTYTSSYAPSHLVRPSSPSKASSRLSVVVFPLLLFLLSICPKSVKFSKLSYPYYSSLSLSQQQQFPFSFFLFSLKLPYSVHDILGISSSVKNVEEMIFPLILFPLLQLWL